ncbi:MAG: peptidyl-prolyl cis-trans isomerase, partial [Omnitrophica bacterium]|nr:peptidyl-prolyl cis-trans isomerase [Candidatus Omnitrophota bacterium]
LYQAKKKGIKVTDQEVISFIQGLAFFHKEGRFNQERYKLLLEYFFRTPSREFEEQIRQTLILDKLKNQLIDNVKVNDEEIEQVYKNEQELARASYVLIEPQSFQEQVHPAYEELEQYYQKHKAEFKKLEQVNVQYIALYFDQDSPKVDITEEEIRDYYERHTEEFLVKDKKESTKPLAEVTAEIKEKLSQEKAKELLEDRIWQIADRIGEETAVFEDLAKQNQLEIQETGFFGSQDVIAQIGLSYEFLNAAFSLEIDEISNVIETPKGYFIIKIKEKKEPYIPALDKIKVAVEEALIIEKSRELAKEEAQDLASRLKGLVKEEALSFEKAAEKLTLTVKETEGFSKISYISGIGQSPEFAQAAFALKPGAVSEAIAVPAGYCILSLKEIIPIEEEKFIQEKEKFSQKVLERKKDIFYRIWLNDLKNKASLENNTGKLKN